MIKKFMYIYFYSHYNLNRHLIYNWRLQYIKETWSSSGKKTKEGEKKEKIHVQKLAQFHAFPCPANFRTEKRVLPRKREKQI